MLQVVFFMGLLQGYMTQPTKFNSISECSAVEYSEVKRVG
jgi:hypothetical protein